MDIFFNYVGTNVRKILKNKGISIHDASRHLNMSVSGVYDVLKRKVISDELLLEKLAELTGEPVSSFLNSELQPFVYREAGEVSSSGEKSILEWKSENEFLKEQIKEKDILIKMMLSKLLRIEGVS